MEYSFSYLLSYIVEAAIIWQYASTLFVPRHSLAKRASVICGLYLLMFALSLLGCIWLNMTLYLLANFFFLFNQYRIKCSSSFFHAAILSGVMGTSELIIYGIAEYFTPNFLQKRQTSHTMILFSIFSKILFFTIIFIIAHLLKGKKKCDGQEDRSTLLLVFIPITSLFVTFTFTQIGETISSPSFSDWMVSISSFLLLASNLLVFGISQYNQKKNWEFTQMQLLLQRESTFADYYEMLREQNENQSILIHDIKKHLQSINLLNEKKEHEKVSAYIRQLMLSSDLKESAKLCDHEMLNLILCRYVKQFAGKHIAFQADIRKGTTDFITDHDLTSLFCNLLDNALEAASHVPDSFVELNAAKKEKTPFVVITMINSCRKNPFNGQDKSLSTKKPHAKRHGFGIKSIRKAVDNYQGGLQMYYDEDTLTFHTIITLKTKPPVYIPGK